MPVKDACRMLLRSSEKACRGQGRSLGGTKALARAGGLPLPPKQAGTGLARSRCRAGGAGFGRGLSRCRGARPFAARGMALRTGRQMDGGVPDAFAGRVFLQGKPPEGSNDGARTGTRAGRRAAGPGGGQGAGQKRAAAPADHRPESDRQRGSGKPCAFPLLLPVAGLRTGGALTRRRQQKLCSCALPDGQDAGAKIKGEGAVNTRQIDFPIPNFAGA